MRHDSHHALRLAGSFGSGPQGRAQSAFVLGNRALGVPPPPVNSRGKAVVHLPAVACLRSGIPNASGVDRNDRRSNAQGFATEAMVPFGIVGPVAKEAIDRQVLRGLRDRRHKIGGIGGTPRARFPNTNAASGTRRGAPLVFSCPPHARMGMAPGTRRGRWPALLFEASSSVAQRSAYSVFNWQLTVFSCQFAL